VHVVKGAPHRSLTIIVWSTELGHFFSSLMNATGPERQYKVTGQRRQTYQASVENAVLSSAQGSQGCFAFIASKVCHINSKVATLWNVSGSLLLRQRSNRA